MTMATASIPLELFDLAGDAGKRYHVYPLINGRKKRWIEAPDPELKQAQRWLLDHWLYQLEPTDLAHGFVPGRSILTNAGLHVGREWVVTADIRNFFPSISAARVSEAIADLEVSEPEQELLVKLVTRRGRLPQGAPTSPHLANLVARNLDLRLAGLAGQDDWTYSRYADDLAFSGSGDPHQLMWTVERIVTDEGFRLAADKTHIRSQHQRQVVTGLVVNQRGTLPKPKRRLLRSMMHRLKTEGIDSVDLHQLQVVHGHLALARLIDPEEFTNTCRELSAQIRLRL